ncbi:unnamed protein product [Dovyalis caffra]|uniref:Retrotransposon gag domain-containing protein n=1 Tax=Dovyalis caffra TaxID=77055 RepID=A0AAV1QVV2_9ROSI|nr:unnamed protein product [Dovyalis caffra]
MISSKNIEGTSQSDQRDVGDKRNTPFSYGSSHKLEFPKFDGEDFRGWVMKAECHFEVEDIPPHMKAGIIYTSMGPRFEALVYDDPLVDLRNPRQTGTLQDYIDEFDVIYPRLRSGKLKSVSFFIRSCYCPPSARKNVQTSFISRSLFLISVTRAHYRGYSKSHQSNTHSLIP